MEFISTFDNSIVTMEFICPTCSSHISPENINVATDLAKCVNCNSMHKASDLKKPIDKEKLMNLPKDTEIILTKGLGGSFKLFLPKKGFTAASIGISVFATFWLCFIAFWTWGASQGSVIFALFSIPFWLVGIGMVISIINSTRGTQSIHVVNNTLVIAKKQPIYSKEVVFKIKDINRIEMQNIKDKSNTKLREITQLNRFQNNLTAGNSAPTVVSGAKMETFFESASSLEQEWVTALLSAVVDLKKSEV